MGHREKHSAAEPSRLLNTTYQNTSGRPIIVYGSVDCSTGSSSTGATATCKTDSSSPPTTNVMRVGVQLNGPARERNVFAFLIIVQQNDYYRVDTTTGSGASVSLVEWWEVDF